MQITLKSLVLPLVGLLFFSCQKHTPMEYTTWRTGEDESNLVQIQSIQASNSTKEIIYANSRIQFQQQSISGQLVENTFIKKVFEGQTPRISAADALFVNPSQFTDKKLKPLIPNSQKLVEKIKNEIAPLQIRNYNSQSVFKLEKNILKTFQVVQYEASDGTLWKATFSPNKKLLQNIKLGSQFADAQIQVYEKGPKLGPLIDVFLKSIETGPTLSNPNLLVESESTQKISSTLPLLKFDPKDDRFDQIQVYYYLDFIQGWIKSNLDIRFTEKLQAVVNVGYPEKTNTAFYFQNKIRFGRGDNISYTMMASDASIVFHESFHAVIDGLAHLPFENEGGSINEGFADFFTCVVLNRPYLGESAYVPAPYRRSIATPMKLDEKNGGLYHDSQIVSSLLWEIKEKLGSEKALRIAVQVLARLNPSSLFKDFNQNILQVLSNEDRLVVVGLLKTQGFLYE